MSKIKIKNFGAIKEGYLENEGWIDIQKTTIFIGNQGSGKSTIAKLISTFTWIEKVLVRGDYDKKAFERINKLKNSFLKYHRLENYFNSETIIDYKGAAYHITYQSERLIIKEEGNSHYSLPQIMYVPSERNFISYVKSAKELKLTSGSFMEFLAVFDEAKNEIKDLIALPISGARIEYDRLNDNLNIKGIDYKIKLSDSSSGFQSLVPLYLVSLFLSNSVKKHSESKPMSADEAQRFKKGIQEIWGNNDLTEEQKKIAVSALSSKFNKTAFINIVEEPEQNLFPSSQWKVLQSLLALNNNSDNNKLIITTHSPYIVNFISIVIQGNYLKNKIKGSKKENELLQKLKNVLDEKALIPFSDVVIYEFDNKGGIKKLPNIGGIPSDSNFLNNALADANELFDKLLEIEQEL